MALQQPASVEAQPYWLYVFAWLGVWFAMVCRVGPLRQSLSGPQLIPNLTLIIVGVLGTLGAAMLGWQTTFDRSAERLVDRIAIEREGVDIELSGVVNGIAQRSDQGLRFNLMVDEHHQAVPKKIALSWYAEARRRTSAAAGIEALPLLKPGERWKMTVRLRRPHGNINPHGFDFELFALERNVGATGYVRPKTPPQRLEEFVPSAANMVDRLRYNIAERIAQSLKESPFAGVITALVVGEQGGISAGQWQVFWATGVGHLISISGLHVSMFAALAFAIATWLWPRLPMAQTILSRMPTQKAATVVGVFAALAYSLIAGFSVPTQRTFYMLAVAGTALILGWRFSITRVMALAACVVVLLDPWALLSPGFWLSFGAVAAMVYAATMKTNTPILRSAFVAQAAVTLIMAPVLLLLFQEVSLLSPIANAFAIPIVSWVVVPLALAGALLDWGLLLNLSAWIFSAVHMVLTWLASFPNAAWQSHAPVWWAVPFAIFGTLLLFLPRVFVWRWLGLLWWLPVFLIKPTTPNIGEVWVDVLDVGQGLAVVVKTAQHAMVYDAGPSYSPDRDAGQRVVVPHLRGEGITRLDKLVITHDDDDHYGGAVSVLTARKPDEMLSSLPSKHRAHSFAAVSKLCESGQQWEWDGVKFIVHWPNAEAYEEGGKKDNAMGCVIEVQTPSHSMLLTADIETKSELELVEVLGGALQADVLLIPHHGSKTSSTDELLDAVKPNMAILPVGYRNRFRHPHPEVMERYAVRDIEVYRSDERGAIRVKLPAKLTEQVAVTSTREVSKRFWRDEVARQLKGEATREDD